MVRHARASRATISVLERDGSVTATVSDDGRGFDPSAVEPGRGLGLIGMEERAEMMGGSLRVESLPGEGTSVRLEIPLTEGGAADG